MWWLLTSIGVATTKYIVKNGIALSKKTNGLTVVPIEKIPKFLYPLEVKNFIYWKKHKRF